MKKTILKKAEKIRLLILDVDGVLTNGKIYYTDTGAQIKPFYVSDGLGIKMLLRSGVTIAVISGKKSPATKNRLKELGIKYIYLGHENKNVIFKELINKLQVKKDEIAYMGDDIPDLSIMQKVGFSIAVANAHHIILKNALLITENKGGKGAVREICDLIMTAQKTLTRQIKYYQ